MASGAISNHFDAEAAGQIFYDDLAEEAQRIVYELCDAKPANPTRQKDCHEIRLSPSLRKNITAVMLTALKAELPYDKVVCLSDPADADDLYLYIPYEDKDAHVGVGLAGNQKRYRDENGVLTIPISEVKKLTRAEADAYYVNGGQYIYKGMLFTYHRYPTKTLDGEDIEEGRFIHGLYNNFMGPASLGTFLPDVASVGNEIVSVKDTRFQSMPCLTKSLKELVAGNMKT